MSNSLDPDQARRFVGPDLGPKCLPRLSADGTGRQRVKLGTSATLVLSQCNSYQSLLIHISHDQFPGWKHYHHRLFDDVLYMSVLSNSGCQAHSHVRTVCKSDEVK